MQIYNDENQSNQSYKQQSTSRSFFPRSELNDWTPKWEKLFFFLFGWLGIQLLATVVTYLVILFPNTISNGNLTVLGSTLINFLCYAIACIVVLLMIFLDKRHTYARIFSGFKDPKALLWGLIGFGFIIGSQSALSYFFTLVFPFYGSNSNQSTINTMTYYYPWLVFIEVVFMAPFIEEITYRAGLLDLIGHNYQRRWLGIILSALLFGFIHTDFVSPFLTLFEAASNGYTEEVLTIFRETIYNELLNFPVYALCGFGLGFVYSKSGKIASSMTAHLLNNLFSVVSIIIEINIANGNMKIF